MAKPRSSAEDVSGNESMCRGQTRMRLPVNSFIAHCLVNTLESRIIPNLHDSLLFRGITDLRNKVELVRKALFSGNSILDSRAVTTNGIFGQNDAEVGDQYLPNLVIVSSRTV